MRVCDNIFRLRPLSYPHTDLFFILFSVGNRESFKNVLERWKPEIKRFCSKTPKVLIGAQTDVRQSIGEKAISTSEGIEMAKKIGALAYFELSSKYKRGIDKPFEFAAKLAVYKLIPKQEVKKCLIQ